MIVAIRWEAQQRGLQPTYEIEANRIDEGYFVGVTFPDGKAETIYGFKSELDAIKWVRCEAVVWLYNRRAALKEAAG